MTEQKTPGDKTLHMSPNKTLTIKRPVEQGTVRQSFSHGRTKQVVVETVKRRVIGPGGKEVAAPAAPAPKAAAPAPSAAPATPRAATPTPAAPARPAGATRPSGVVLRTLSEQERDARAAALVDARKREEEERRRQEDEAQRRAVRDDEERREREAAEARKREEDDRRRQEDDRKRRAEEEARRRLGDAPARAPSAAPSGAPAQARPLPGGRPAPIPAPRPTTASDGAAGGTRRPPSLDSMARPAPAPKPEPTTPAATPAPAATARPATGAAARPAAAGDDEARPARRLGLPIKPAAVPKPAKGAGDDKRRGRLTVTNALDDERTRSLAAFRRRNQRLLGRGQQEQKEKLSREVVIPETITIQELANRMSERGVDVIRLLMKQGQMHKITDVIDADTAQLV
ncbi:MAG TPA: translation initiation factor IF-2 associated domain-containing protein, partial [Salinarimonas sp.]|nr:translation initiation factor IF-2 associated domain-containing protein [Salinarimonas sp.]